MKSSNVLLLFILTFYFGCDPKPAVQTVEQNIIDAILDDEESFYHLDFRNYPKDKKSLPVGVFDSGTGGLTVLKAIVNFDEFNNSDNTPGADDILDFDTESFIYLGDQANMPYGNYANENKVDLLKEHIIKDAQFLLGNKYYGSRNQQKYKTDKSPVKAIVVACNTATAYGKTYIEEFLSRANSDIQVIGVIDAGVRGALDQFKKDEDGIIGVLATAGTVASKGYSQTIVRLKDDMGYTGNIEVFQQGGVGIAEAVDEDANYFIKGLEKPRKEYKGPGLSGDLLIDKALMDIYNFDFSNGKMLCDNNNPNDCSIMQINDGLNYVRYHLVTLMENIRHSGSQNTLKALILGCTHYPYLTKEINQVLKELYAYQDDKGDYIYQKNMVKNIALIDPSLNTARELYAHLDAQDMFNAHGSMQDSEFYISVANTENKQVQTDASNNFTYDYKYGRQVHDVQEYTKIVPFSRSNISDDILLRFRRQIPFVYELMKNFNSNNSKTDGLDELSRIR